MELDVILVIGQFAILAIALMFFTAYEMGVKSVKSDIAKREAELEVKSKVLEKEQIELVQNQQEVSTLKSRLMEENDLFEKAKNDTLSAIQWMAKAYADLDSQKLQYSAFLLENKTPSAPIAADKVREAARARKAAVCALQQYKLQIDYFTSLFPWLEDYLLLTPEEISKMATEASTGSEISYDSYDAVKNWLSPEEYAKLSNTDKWQLALDRYNKRKKTPWQIGIEYERYIGYLYEKKGYKVHYIGATKGLKDMGRDLIAESNSQCVIIQCKRWSTDKTIHEKHIFQLYGTCVLYKLQHANKKDIHGLFITTTSLSSVAKQCANYLGIEVREHFPHGTYPQIKCNFSKYGEQIYHLPFDQQYDHTLITPYSKDFYAFTVQEAEQKGFRRAFRWHGK